MYLKDTLLIILSIEWGVGRMECESNAIVSTDIGEPTRRITCSISDSISVPLYHDISS
jgi:hypothetical protein